MLSAWTASEALLWTQRLAAFAVLPQTLELLRIRRSFSAPGVWVWKGVREEFARWPALLRAVLDFCLAYRGFLVLLASRAAAAFALGLAPEVAPLAGVLVLWISTVLIGLRWRGTYNGGSDSMTVVVLTGLLIAAYGDNEGALARLGLAYIGVQLVFSYFVAGWVKLRDAGWRSGRLLGDFIARANYEIPARVRNVAEHRPAALLVGAWSVMGFECLFPLSLVRHEACAALLMVAFLFHLGNFAVFGLNRFVSAWLAAYPALIFLSGLRHF